jgi:hypothetical protein
MPSPNGPRAEIEKLLADSTDPVRTATLNEVLDIMAQSKRYGYPQPAPNERVLAARRRTEYNTIKNREYIDKAIHRCRPYTPEELVLVANLSMTSSTVARRLGRTLKGVQNTRSRLRKEGKL